MRIFLTGQHTDWIAVCKRAHVTLLRRLSGLTTDELLPFTASRTRAGDCSYRNVFFKARKAYRNERNIYSCSYRERLTCYCQTGHNTWLFSRYRSRKVQHPIWSREKYTYDSIKKHQEIRSMVRLASFDATRLASLSWFLTSSLATSFTTYFLLFLFLIQGNFNTF